MPPLLFLIPKWNSTDRSQGIYPPGILSLSELVGQVPSPEIHFPGRVGLCPQTSSSISVVFLGSRDSLTSPSYLARNRTLGPPLENNPEPPPSSRLEGLRLCMA